eukprot:362539-Chlamydomonas_euryale.AAC.3
MGRESRSFSPVHFPTGQEGLKRSGPATMADAPPPVWPPDASFWRSSRPNPFVRFRDRIVLVDISVITGLSCARVDCRARRGAAQGYQMAGVYSGSEDAQTNSVTGRTVVALPPSAPRRLPQPPADIE